MSYEKAFCLVLLVWLLDRKILVLDQQVKIGVKVRVGLGWPWAFRIVEVGHHFASCGRTRVCVIIIVDGIRFRR